MVHFTTEAEWTIVDHRTKIYKIKLFSKNNFGKKTFDLLALVTNMFPHASRFGMSIAIVTKRPILIANKSRIGQFLVTHFAKEALRMPIGVHSFDDATDDKLACNNIDFYILNVKKNDGWYEKLYHNGRSMEQRASENHARSTFDLQIHRKFRQEKRENIGHI